MPISPTDILRVRRMTNEPTQTPYSDQLITTIAEDHAYTVNNWPDADITAYDLHAIAADIWEEKAAALAPDYDFQADGASYTRSQAYEQAHKQAQYHYAHRRVQSRKIAKAPSEAQMDALL